MFFCKMSQSGSGRTLGSLWSALALGRLEIHIALSNPNIDVRESSFRVIMLPSLAYLYFELDIEQNELRKTLLIHKQKTE